MNITVIVPTYRRPKDLDRCLQALKNQTRPADEVIVTVRDIDTETWNYLTEFNLGYLPLHTVTVKTTGVIAAMNLGVDVAQGEIITFTDDDAAPHPDWLEKIEAHFLADELLKGVGGRDVAYKNGELIKGEKKIVGKVQWFGRMIGNQHLGVGNARQVDVLKGVNMSFHRSAFQGLRFDNRMKGTGAQVHFEVAFCLALKKAGWKIIYDPNILVDHHLAKRFDEDKRGEFGYIAKVNEIHNYTLAILEFLPFYQKIIFLVWSIFIGTNGHFGFLQFFRFFPSEGLLTTNKLAASITGQVKGIKTYLKTNRFLKEKIINSI